MRTIKALCLVCYQAWLLCWEHMICNEGYRKKLRFQATRENKGVFPPNEGTYIPNHHKNTHFLEVTGRNSAFRWREKISWYFPKWRHIHPQPSQKKTRFILVTFCNYSFIFSNEVRHTCYLLHRMRLLVDELFSHSLNAHVGARLCVCLVRLGPTWSNRSSDCYGYRKRKNGSKCFLQQ